MFEQAAGLAVIAAFYPPAMLIAALYLASERPSKMMVLYVLGGILIVTVVGTAALIAIRDAGLSLPTHHQTRYGVRLGLGVLALVAAVLIYRRKPKPAKPKKEKKPSLIARLSHEPKPLTALAVGVVMFGPSLTFLAAVQVVATAKASLAATVAAMAMIIVITVAFAWLPLMAYLISPNRTRHALQTFESWLRRYRKQVLAAAVGLIGVLLIIQGSTGLA
jgi:hypothetical protein